VCVLDECVPAAAAAGNLAEGKAESDDPDDAPRFVQQEFRDCKDKAEACSTAVGFFLSPFGAAQESRHHIRGRQCAFLLPCGLNESELDAASDTEQALAAFVRARCLHSTRPEAVSGLLQMGTECQCAWTASLHGQAGAASALPMALL
jgi:hypothetical protein